MLGAPAVRGRCRLETSSGCCLNRFAGGEYAHRNRQQVRRGCTPAACVGGLQVPMSEAAALEQTAWVIIALAAVTFIALLWLKAPYGRYSSSASWIYGFQMDGKVAWILQVTAAPADAVTYQRTPDAVTLASLRAGIPVRVLGSVQRRQGRAGADDLGQGAVVHVYVSLHQQVGGTHASSAKFTTRS